MTTQTQPQGLPLQGGAAEKEKLFAELLRYHHESTPGTLRQKSHHAEIEKMKGHEPGPVPNYLYNEAHQKAALKLHLKFPKLSSSAIDVAVMLGHGLSNKCIATFRGVTERAIEKARERMREKMKMRAGQDLIKKIRKVIA